MTPIIRIFAGSRLHGLSGPESDTDMREVFLAEMQDLVMGNMPKSYSTRHDANEADCYDPALCVTTQHIPIQMFINDFYDGELYAIELASAVAQLSVDNISIDGDIIDDNSNIEASIIPGRNHLLWVFSKFCKELLAKHLCVTQISFLEKTIARAEAFAQKFIAREEVEKIESIVKSIAKNSGIDETEKMKNQWGLLRMSLGDLSTVMICADPKHLNYEKAAITTDIILVFGRMFSSESTFEEFLGYLKSLKKKLKKKEPIIETGSFKAACHSLRVLFELETLLNGNNITYPIPEEQRALLMLVKHGDVPESQIKMLIEDTAEKVFALYKAEKMKQNVLKDNEKHYRVALSETEARQEYNRCVYPWIKTLYEEAKGWRR